MGKDVLSIVPRFALVPLAKIALRPENKCWRCNRLHWTKSINVRIMGVAAASHLTFPSNELSRLANAATTYPASRSERPVLCMQLNSSHW